MYENNTKLEPKQCVINLNSPGFRSSSPPRYSPRVVKHKAANTKYNNNKFSFIITTDNINAHKQLVL